ncbi:hypothetical protein P153DRAFT_83216 [Dothidotthia symphoricarpi CBS 119687]|uniref:Uncharacterized protein n=1 Tax=Dothidotthia symphoricarpi CBS 119687 TaxID=1392245 RepID=A0A6A6A4B5_9PLEO|nr:uncharacterized protein P153DRAFT_83216 [Dothidotthia symphoricarpi CBS 119687]KAF2126015.1 hypothetical protein P153DRAFT_83216 [Dothidotthia symphoricarpi CBS 119687]
MSSKPEPTHTFSPSSSVTTHADVPQSSLIMPRLALLLVGALLALVSTVDAAKKDTIRLYKFNTDDCAGAPDGANIDVVRDQCVSVGTASSLKPAFHNNRDWINEINSGKTSCWLIPYEQPGCQQGQELKSIPLPQEMFRCYSDGDERIRSVKFACSIEKFYSTTWTTTIAHTSWSIGRDERPTPVLSTTSLTITGSYVTSANPTAAVVLAVVPNATTKTDLDHVEPRTQDDTDSDLEDDTDAPDSTPVPAPSIHRRDAERQRQSKGVWMLHPWSATPLCYECYTKGKTNDFSKFDCRSGPNNIVNCGDKPELGPDNEPVTRTAGETSTSTITTTTSLTSHTTTTSTTSSVDDSTSTVSPKMARSWHRRVAFENPFVSGNTVCADAEWEKRGQADTEIRLQKIGSDMKKCDKAQAQTLNIPKPVTVRPTTVTTMTTIESATSTSTTSLTMLKRVTVAHGDL